MGKQEQLPRSVLATAVFSNANWSPRVTPHADEISDPQACFGIGSLPTPADGPGGAAGKAGDLSDTLEPAPEARRESD